MLKLVVTEVIYSLTYIRESIFFPIFGKKSQVIFSKRSINDLEKYIFLKKINFLFGGFKKMFRREKVVVFVSSKLIW